MSVAVLYAAGAGEIAAQSVVPFGAKLPVGLPCRALFRESAPVHEELNAALALGDAVAAAFQNALDRVQLARRARRGERQARRLLEAFRRRERHALLRLSPPLQLRHLRLRQRCGRRFFVKASDERSRAVSDKRLHVLPRVVLRPIARPAHSELAFPRPPLSSGRNYRFDGIRLRRLGRVD